VSAIILYGGLLLGFLLVAGAAVALFTGSRTEVDERMDRYVGGSAAAAAIPVRESRMPRRPAVGERLDTAIGERGFTKNIRARIAKADVKLRVSEYLGLRVVSALLVAAAVYFFAGQLLPLAIIGLIVGSFIPPFYLSFAARRRMRAFEDQLSQTLNLWVNALRSGYSVLQSMEAIATELPPPVSVEFERVVQEVRLGLSVPQALSNMLRRMPSDDLDLVVTAVNIQREVGGNLAEVLDVISFTIRERVRIKGEIRTLTAQGRLSGWIISMLPIFLALVLMGINADYMSQLWVDLPPRVGPVPCGWITIGIGLIMMAIGIYIIQRIVDIEV
jgi:tight adherence protein B